MQTKTLFTGFSPNLTVKAVRKACGFLWLPWRWLTWQRGTEIEKVESWLKSYFDVPHAITFDSGRTALYAALEALGIEEGDEVLVQAYTCVVVVNAIKWTGAVPVFIDIDGNTLNMSPEDIRKKLTEKTKVMIIQHTFGLPADIKSLTDIAHEHGIKTIEDCAHSLGTKYKDEPTGTFADVSMFSFGSDKVVSCVRGGALITKDDGYARKIHKYHDTLPETNVFRIWQHLMHYPLFFIGKKLYHLGAGKWILGLAKKIGLINKIIYKQEKDGRQVPFYPSKFPNALASLLLPQLKKLEKTIEHRRNISDIYRKLFHKKIQAQKHSTDHTYLRFTLFVEQPKAVRSIAKNHGIFLGNWYDTVIAPKDIDWSRTGYEQKSCPNAESYAKKSVNLPTHIGITPESAKKIASLILEHA